MNSHRCPENLLLCDEGVIGDAFVGMVELGLGAMMRQEA